MNIYAGNLPWSAGDQELEDLFAAFGNVQRARVIMDRETGRSRGFGFVEMDDDGARKAIDQLNGTELEIEDFLLFTKDTFLINYR